MKSCERVFDNNNNNFIGIIHEVKGKWYVIMPFGFSNLFTEGYCTCDNGIVRKNQCSKALTWDNKELAISFMRYIYYDTLERRASETL